MKKRFGIALCLPCFLTLLHQDSNLQNDNSMTETQFTKNLKKWFFGSLLIQIVLGAAWIIYTGGTMNTTVTKNTEDIRSIMGQMDKKADINMVLRIKGDQDRMQQMILDNTKDLKTGQLQLMNIMINHISKEK